MKSEHMSEGEKVHFLTEGIYRNLIDNFNPGIRQIIISGRSFQKALHNVATTAKVYIDTIYNIAQNAQMCKGATSEMGAALLQIAEVHKEINTQVIDNIKTFHAELLIPLETKQESEFRQTSSIYKKYIAGHKYHSVPVDKAQTALKKYRKKHKSAKYGFDQKDFQFSREVKEHQAKLDEYRVTSLRHALLEERKRYCFLLDRICAIVRSLASHHSKAHELLTHRLQEWSTHTLAPHILPDASEAVIASFKVAQFPDEMFPMGEESLRNEGPAGGSNGSTDSPYDRQDGPTNRESILYGHSAPPSLHYGTSNMFTSESDYAVHMMMTSQPMISRPQVRALYNHHGNNSTQLNFSEGDVITLIGEKKDGWQYGQLSGNNRMGWFPIAFTQPIETNGLAIHNRHRSLGNLSSLGHGSGANTPEPPEELPPDPSSNYLQRSHTITERPVSLYATRPPGPQKMVPTDRSLTWVCLDGQQQGHPLPSRPEMLIYQHPQSMTHHYADAKL